MTKEEIKALKPGIYRLYWRSGGTSLAAVGVTRGGGRWMAPLNWVEPSVDQWHWDLVSKVTFKDVK